VLFVQNPGNSGYGSEYMANLGNIAAAVSNGMVLVLHDRHVTGAAGVLPGGGAISSVRDFSDDAAIDVLNAGNLITDGPGGIVNDATLDGGGSSTHGYADGATLPAGAAAVLSRTDANEIVTFAYPYGKGWVVYSTIPLDYYLSDPFITPVAFRNIYAPNVVAFGAALVSSP
jgi:hypothetical protein